MQAYLKFYFRDGQLLRSQREDCDPKLIYLQSPFLHRRSIECFSHDTEVTTRANHRLRLLLYTGCHLEPELAIVPPPLEMSSLCRFPLKANKYFELDVD